MHLIYARRVKADELLGLDVPLVKHASCAAGKARELRDSGGIPTISKACEAARRHSLKRAELRDRQIIGRAPKVLVSRDPAGFVAV